MFPGHAAVAAEAKAIPKNFLLYEKPARADTKNTRWFVIEGGKNEDVWNAQCTPAKLKGWSARRDVSYDPELGGGEKTNRMRGEQVFLFTRESGARTMMATMRKLMKGCEQITPSSPKVGEEAVAGVLRIKGKVPQTQQFVAVRRGGAIALYWDLANQAKPLRTMAWHVKDARAMAKKLCSITSC